VLLGALATGGCGRLDDAEIAREESPAARLGAYHRGMDLHATFDSLSRGPAQRARVELLDDNARAWTARWRLVAGAHETIDVDYFIFSQDAFGTALLGHLIAKAREGVSVRVLLDAQGLRMSQQPDRQDCLGLLAATPNASVRIHRAMERRLMEAVARLDPIVAAASDHDKIIVVDRRASIVGGRNIEAKYFAHPDDLPDAFHDVDAAIESPEVARTLTAVFDTTWDSERAAPIARQVEDAERCAAGTRLAHVAMDAWMHDRPLTPDARAAIEEQGFAWWDELRRYPRLSAPAAVRSVRAEVRVVDSLPRAGSAADAVSRSLARLFHAASRSVLMETPYVVLTEEAAAVLETTGRRGVAMTVLTNSPVSTDNLLSQMYFQEQWPRLLAMVPRLRLFAEGTTHNVHGKVAVFDGEVVLLGSYNLDPFSMLISGELMVAVRSRAFARQVAAKPRAMIARGAPQVYEYRIARDDRGEPVRTPTGEVVIAFGPSDHADGIPWPRRGVRWGLVRAVPWLSGLPPLF
jgi:phosphatidylserine/phosphatidylglycerophosphate/cardiolipin synthase-like enzyme